MPIGPGDNLQAALEMGPDTEIIVYGGAHNIMNITNNYILFYCLKVYLIIRSYSNRSNFKPKCIFNGLWYHIMHW